MSMLRITLNASSPPGAKARIDPMTEGYVVEVGGPADLVRALMERGPRYLGWIVLGVLEDDSRAQGKAALARSGTQYDLDYYAGAHTHSASCPKLCRREFEKCPSGLPPALWQRFRADCLAGKLSDLIQIAYDTPNGIRGIGLYANEVTDPKLWKPIAVGSIQAMRGRLKNLGYNEPPHGLLLDAGVTDSPKRLLYLHDAYAKGRQRHGELLPFATALLDAPSFIPPDWTDEPPPDIDAVPDTTTTKATPSVIDAHKSFKDARDSYVERYGRHYPERLTTCPTGHPGSACFHAHPKDPSLWVCFSSHHPEGCGNYRSDGGEPHFWGDALHLDAFALGKGLAEQLREAGFLRDEVPWPVSEWLYERWKVTLALKERWSKIGAKKENPY